MQATKIFKKLIQVAIPDDGDALVYNASTGKWEFSSLKTGTFLLNVIDPLVTIDFPTAPVVHYKKVGNLVTLIATEFDITRNGAAVVIEIPTALMPAVDPVDGIRWIQPYTCVDGSVQLGIARVVPGTGIELRSSSGANFTQESVSIQGFALTYSLVWV